jgi:hypothetical protein
VHHPSPDQFVVTMTGSAVAYHTPQRCCSAGFHIDLSQCFTVRFNDSKVKAAKLSISGRTVGILRSHCKGDGTASLSSATASVGCDAGGEMASVSMPAHTACGGQNVSINDQEGPYCIPVVPGCYTLRQCFEMAASAPRCVLPCKAPSAEFAPDAIEGSWISAKEPFHGAAKDQFGFQVTITVSPLEDGELLPVEGNAPKANVESLSFPRQVIVQPAEEKGLGADDR